VGGRWNSGGYSVIYMAESIALAVLENLVHMSREDFPRGYVVVGASLPDDLPMLSDEDLRREYGDLSSPALGDRWLARCSSTVLRVPSRIVPSEHNYLLNPKHSRFHEIIVEMPVPFEFDERLFPGA
jgi:RES domain-containing protein